MKPWESTKEALPLWCGKAFLADTEATAGFEPAMGVLQTPALPLGYVAGDSLPSRWYFTTRVDGASSATGLSAYRRLKTEDGYNMVEAPEDGPPGSVEWCLHIRRSVLKWGYCSGIPGNQALLGRD